MLSAASSATREKRVDAAIHEIAARLRSGGRVEPETAAVFFASDEYGPALEKIGRGVGRASGASSVIGCGAESVVGSEGEDSGSAPGIAALTLSGLTGVERFYLPGLRGQSECHGREIGRLVSSRGSDDRATILLFADSYTLAPDELLNGISDTAGPVPVIGAGATESGSTGVTSVAAHGVSGGNAVSGLILRGVSVLPVRAPIYAPVGSWWKVTSSSLNRIERLDGRPALERVLESLPETLRDDPEASLGLVQVAVSEGEEAAPPLLRPIVGADPERGALMIGDEVVTGCRVALATPDPVLARRALETALERLSAVPDLAAVLYFHSSLGGRSPYGLPSLDSAYVRRELGSVPLAGCGSYVTISPHLGRNRFHHFSGLLAGLAPVGAISENEAWGR